MHPRRKGGGGRAGDSFIFLTPNSLDERRSPFHDEDSFMHSACSCGIYHVYVLQMDLLGFFSTLGNQWHFVVYCSCWFRFNVFEVREGLQEGHVHVFRNQQVPPFA